MCVRVRACVCVHPNIHVDCGKSIYLLIHLLSEPIRDIEDMLSTGMLPKATSESALQEK